MPQRIRKDNNYVNTNNLDPDFEDDDLKKINSDLDRINYIIVSDPKNFTFRNDEDNIISKDKIADECIDQIENCLTGIRSLLKALGERINKVRDKCNKGTVNTVNNNLDNIRNNLDSIRNNLDNIRNNRDIIEKSLGSIRDDIDNIINNIINNIVKNFKSIIKSHESIIKSYESIIAAISEVENNANYGNKSFGVKRKPNQAVHSGSVDTDGRQFIVNTNKRNKQVIPPRLSRGTYCFKVGFKDITANNGQKGQGKPQYSTFNPTNMSIHRKYPVQNFTRPVNRGSISSTTGIQPTRQLFYGANKLLVKAKRYDTVGRRETLLCKFRPSPDYYVGKNTIALQGKQTRMCF